MIYKVWRFLKLEVYIPSVCAHEALISRKCMGMNSKEELSLEGEGLTYHQGDLFYFRELLGAEPVENINLLISDWDMPLSKINQTHFRPQFAKLFSDYDNWFWSSSVYPNSVFPDIDSSDYAIDFVGGEGAIGNASAPYAVRSDKYISKVSYEKTIQQSSINKICSFASPISKRN